MKIIKPAIVGTLESGDVMIRISPAGTPAIELHINSLVEKQFGKAVRATVLEILARHNISGVQLHIDDKGALDCVLRARLETLLMRAGDSDGTLPWENY